MPGAILIAGPTASGKSALALRIAEATGGTIVNADSMQVYRCWRVLTARPSPDEEARAAHALYGHVPCETAYSTGAWLREVAALLPNISTPILTGGTGLYFRALTRGLAAIPAIPAQTRAAAEKRLAAEGAEAMRSELIGRDPSAAQLDIGNPRRLLRAWEVLEATGRPLAQWMRETPPPLLGDADIAARLVLNPGRDALAARIDTRFAEMIEAGALDEVRAAAGLDPALPAARAVGAPQLRAFLDGALDLDSAIGRASAATRQYAKRQRTWFRNQLGEWPQYEDPEQALRAVLA